MIRIDPLPDGVTDPRCKGCEGRATVLVTVCAGMKRQRWKFCDGCLEAFRSAIERRRTA